MNRLLQLILCLALPIMGTLFPATSPAAEDTMDFTGWDYLPDYGYGEFEGWELNEGLIRNPGRPADSEASFVCYLRPDFATSSLTTAPPGGLRSARIPPPQDIR